MPPICFHLGIAREAAAQLKHPVVEQNRGSYFLGATAPDIRFATGARRDETHFTSLGSDDRESGARELFKAYPGLAGANNLNGSTRAFVAGYLSHLTTDEVWIHEIYRPFFGKKSARGGDVMANLLDRALQFELDRRERANTEMMAAIRADLSRADSGVNIGFIAAADLKNWRDFVIMNTTRDIGSRFRVFAEQYLRMQKVKPDIASSLLTSLDDKMKAALETVSEEQLQGFRRHCVAGSVDAAREYLK